MAGLREVARYGVRVTSLVINGVETSKRISRISHGRFGWRVDVLLSHLQARANRLSNVRTGARILSLLVKSKRSLIPFLGERPVDVKRRRLIAKILKGSSRRHKFNLLERGVAFVRSGLINVSRWTLKLVMSAIVHVLIEAGSKSKEPLLTVG